MICSLWQQHTLVDIQPQTTAEDSDEDWGDWSHSNDSHTDTRGRGSEVGNGRAPTADIPLTILPRSSIYPQVSPFPGYYEPLVSSPSSADQSRIPLPSPSPSSRSQHGADQNGDSDHKSSSALPPASSPHTPRGLRLISPRDLQSQSSEELLSKAEPDAQLLVRLDGTVGVRPVTPRGPKQPDKFSFTHSTFPCVMRGKQLEITRTSVRV